MNKAPGNDPLIRLLTRMADLGAERFFAKQLAPNDNSKNQVYLGGGFGALNIIPHGDIISDTSSQNGSVRDRAKARVDFWWLSDDGLTKAPNAQLILYPKYPEVRMSGFLQNAKQAPSELMSSRDEGRILFLGICPDGKVIGHGVSGLSAESVSLQASSDSIERNGVFLNLQAIFLNEGNSQASLLAALRRVHLLNWIPSQKLGPDGQKHPYSARNGGGYTLEAELGISPNGYSEPDYQGWEVKQYGVNNLEMNRPKSPVTLMTPEPTGGLYQERGIGYFMQEFGYPDQNGVADRRNFGGRYHAGRPHNHLTGLRLALTGYDMQTGRITDLEGQIVLLDRNDRTAASWKFTRIIEHWNRKHAKAVYVPSLSHDKPRAYKYGSRVQICQGTDVLLLIAGLANGVIFYDPGIKTEGLSGNNPRTKKRSQFRVNHKDISVLYTTTETIDLMAN